MVSRRRYARRGRIIIFAALLAATTTLTSAMGETEKGLADGGHAEQLALVLLPPQEHEPLQVTSPGFADGETIPSEYTQFGANRFPGLSWSRGPQSTRSYAVVVQGDGYPKGGGSGGSTKTSVHLTLFDVPAARPRLAAGMTRPPPGATFGPNVHGLNQPYAGPHTHSTDIHVYHWQVFALDVALQLSASARFEDLMQAMQGHVLDSGEVKGEASMAPGVTYKEHAN